MRRFAVQPRTVFSGAPCIELCEYCYIADFRRLAGEVVPDAAKKARNAYEYLTPSNPAEADTELEIPPRPPRPGSLLEYLMNADHPDVSDIELEIPPRSKAQRRPVEF